jgi:integrase
MPKIRISLLTTSKREADKVSSKIDERLEKAFTDIRLMRLTQSESRNLILSAIEFGGSSANEPTLRVVAKEYEKTKGQEWSAKSKQEFWKSVEVVEENLGSRAIRLIDRVMVIDVRDKLHATGIKPRTVNKYIQRLSSIINYAVLTGSASSNPCTASVKFEISKGEIKKNNYAPYSDEDVRWILEDMLQHPKNNRRWTTYMYWLPLLAAFSGARLGDLADLVKGDFIRRGEIDCVIIGNNKTGASPRTVPLHSQLLALGILEWVDTLPSRAQLFNIPRHRREGEYNYKWYMRELRKRIEDPRKVFHSWRSTLSSRLNNADVNATHRADLLGHERKTNCETDKTYTSDTELRMLKECIEKLVYSVDWGKVKIKTAEIL